jgi:UDP-N-acetylmuramyl pentapeptide phosphotransferase/UDP-N-acetylglucosamine-1-phosphate transferase
MPRAGDIPSASLGLAAGLCMIALFLGLREWYERQAREPDLSPADDRHFRHQDVRRRAGVGVLFSIALLALAGSRIDPRPAGRANVLFVALWVLVLTMIVVLLGLALADLLATRAYARRQHRQMLRESLEAIRQQTRRASPNPRGPSDPAPHEPGH